MRKFHNTREMSRYPVFLLLLLSLVNADIFVLDEEPSLDVDSVDDFPGFGEHVGAFFAADFAAWSPADVNQSFAAESHHSLVVHVEERGPAEEEDAG